ncbi:hypothetical protein HHK36_021248 [Tetracentron sinense]|uniref:AUGMIN subunit 8 n=1 Tax=Tetracentron sinense TaxID=13715 RepID=A0A834YWI1_TETSI|nr:hypothetical protein HHK36_021248 [Tetracentron sinense]
MVWMDVFEAEQAPQKGTAEETTRPPLVPSEKNNAVTRRPRTREVMSRYKAAITSPSLPTPTVPRRSASPNSTRTVHTSSSLLSKRAQSAERRRPSTPPSPPSPSTPVHDSSAELHISSRRMMSGRNPEGLWPSTMRSLCVSFQSDTFSLPISRREKPISHASSDHTLRSSANVVHKQAETPAVQRKVTPERKRSPLRGKNVSDQLENSKPMDNSHARLVDQHRWPSRTGGKVSAIALTRSIDLVDKGNKASSLPIPGRGVSPLRRMPSSDGIVKPLQKSASEVSRRLSFDGSGKVEFELYSHDDTSLRLSGPQKLVSSYSGVSSSSSERTSISRTIRSNSLPAAGSRTPSPSKASVLASSHSRGIISPSRTRPANPFPSVSSVASRSNSSSSVLSFIADIKRGKKGMNHIEDVHQLRLLYNRYLQWRYSNARADCALSVQNAIAEKTLYTVWNSTSELWDSVTMKRINVQQLRQELKLNSVLNEQVSFSRQMEYLNDWALLEEDHSNSLSAAIEALEASTLRLPITGGARADVHTVKDAVSSALDVMQAMGSSICSLLSRAEGMNHLISELADLADKERATLDECGDLLASTAAMQVEEDSSIASGRSWEHVCRWGMLEEPALMADAPTFPSSTHHVKSLPVYLATSYTNSDESEK